MKTNAVINEKSPCLLRHAHHPVHWQPWSAAAPAPPARLDSRSDTR